MKNTKNDVQTSTQLEKNVSDIAKCRETICAVYAVQAVDVFTDIAVKTLRTEDGGRLLTKEEVSDVLNKIVVDGVATIYTQPSELCHVTDDMTEVPASFNKALPVGQKWYKKTVAVTDATVVLRAFSNYLRYKADKDKALLRTAKKALSEMSQEELIKFVLAQQEQK